MLYLSVPDAEPSRSDLKSPAAPPLQLIPPGQRRNQGPVVLRDPSPAQFATHDRSAHHHSRPTPVLRGRVLLGRQPAVHREAAVLVGQHVFGVSLLQQTAAHDDAQDASAHVLLDCRL